MAKKQSKQQQQTVARVMHEFKHGELKTGGDGPKVKNPRQAIAIALHEAGATNQEGAADNARNFRKTKAKERKGETTQALHEGKAAQETTMRRATARAGDRGEMSKAALYEEAKRRDVPGRSKMSKNELESALKA